MIVSSEGNSIVVSSSTDAADAVSVKKPGAVTILEDGTEYSYNTYKMNGKARKVYTVEFSYEDKPFNQTRTYYIDTTTGEVVGGEDIFDLTYTE